MRKQPTINELRARVLKDRGLTFTNPGQGKTKKFVPIVEVNNVDKTPLMKLIEGKYGKGRPIEQILMAGGSLTQLEKEFNYEVERSTISKWFKRFGLRAVDEHDEPDEVTCPSCGDNRVSHNPLDTDYICQECGWHFNKGDKSENGIQGLS